MKVNIKADRVEILGPNKNVAKKLNMEPYWDKKILEKQFLKKYPHALLYVKADFQGRGSNEEFHFNEAWYMHGFSFSNFLNLLKQKVILVDIRIGQYSNGKPHDHGTGFRVMPDKLDLCFSSRKKVL